MIRLTQFKNTTILPVLIALTLGCFGLTPQARAVDPPPDGGYPGQNTAEGDNALFSLTQGGLFNTALGYAALYSNTVGSYNTATGWSALYSNGAGGYNTASGWSALHTNISGSFNTASGYSVLHSNTFGSYNTASGMSALYNNTTGNFNTASGVSALLSNTTGSYNTAIGSDALHYNTIGSNNTATGEAALFGNDGGNNTADGQNALRSNTTGNGNTATGQAALLANKTGRYNTAGGQNALRSNQTGSFNIALGANAGLDLTSGDNNIDIGNRGVAGEENTIRIGEIENQTATFIAGISGATVAEGVGVIVDSQGHLGTVVSSERFKDAIKPMNKASESILALQPVTFRYKHDLDPAGIPQFGLVAEDVEKVNPDLVARDDQGKPYTVRYDVVNAMLLNEFLKEHQKVQRLEAALAAINERLKAQDSKIDKVNARVELIKPGSQMVVNDQ